MGVEVKFLCDKCGVELYFSTSSSLPTNMVDIRKTIHSFYLKQWFGNRKYILGGCKLYQYSIGGQMVEIEMLKFDTFIEKTIWPDKARILGSHQGIYCDGCGDK